MTIFRDGVGGALAERSSLREYSASSRSTPSYGPFQMGMDANFMAGTGHYSGLLSKERAYRESPWIQPSIHAFASALAARPFRLFREVGDQKERVAKHWLLDLMAKPNSLARLSEYALKYQTFFLYDFDGEVLWHLGRRGNAKPGPKRTPPEFITIFRRQHARPVTNSSTGEFIGWELSIDGRPYFADRDDVVHFSQFDPLDHRATFNPFTQQVREPNRGRSGLDSKRLAISADIAAARYNYDFFSRGIAPNIAFMTEDEISGGEDDFRDRMRARLAGKSGEPVVLSGGKWTIQSLAAMQKDAEFSKGRAISREEQLAGRVPPIVMGDKDATYANAQAQVLTWWEIVLDPALMHFCATLDSYLLDKEPDVWTDLSTDDVDALQVAKRERLKSATELAKARVPWAVAARTVGLDLEKFEGSDVAFGNYTDIPVTAIMAGDSKAEVATTEPPDAPKPPNVTGETDDTTPPSDQAPRSIRVLAPGSRPAARTIAGVSRRAPWAVVARMAGPFDYASTQVNITGDLAQQILDMAVAIPDDALAEKGRETDPHATVKYGIDPKVSVGEVREALANSDSMLEMAERGGVLTLGRTAVFTADSYDVVYVTCASNDLEILNSVISNGVTVTDTHPEYVPHVTLAYVQAGRGAEFADNDALVGAEFTFDAISFSDTKGVETVISLKDPVQSRAKQPARSRIVTVAGRAFGADDLAAISKLIAGDDEALQKVARKFHVRALQTGAKQIVDLVAPRQRKTEDPVTSLIGLDNPRVITFLDSRANLITSVNSTTADQILAAIRQGTSDGVTHDDIAREIKDTFNLRGKQATLISRQESGSALNGGRFLQLKEEKVGQHEWLSSRDDRVRDSHSEIDGEIVDVGEEFSNGCVYPQDPDGDTDEVMGCRCVSLPADGGDRSRSSGNAEWRATYWRASVVTALRPTEREFTSALQRYFNGQRGRVLAEFAKRFAA